MKKVIIVSLLMLAAMVAIMSETADLMAQDQTIIVMGIRG